MLPTTLTRDVGRRGTVINGLRISNKGTVMHRHTDTGDALFSPHLKYRYVLRRSVPRALGITEESAVAFVMLNPSVADERQDDPTIRRCVDYASRWGHSELYVVNLFAFRSTDPSGLYDESDPIGPLNDDYIRSVAELCDSVVMAWGAHGAHMERSTRVRAMLHEITRPYYLTLTKDGEPGHPLRLRRDLVLTEDTR